MAKFTGPKGKLVRRFGVNIFDNPKYDRLLERRNTKPGQHGPNPARRKISDYGMQLIEKQKLRNTYGLLERQFRRVFHQAEQKKGVTGDNLMALLETRIDNLAFRAGFGRTRMQARQLVNHGHLELNGRRVNIPSCQVQPGDVVTVRDHPKSRALGARYLDENPRFSDSGWLRVDKEAFSVTVVHLPNRQEINSPVNEQLVIELYSK